AVAVSTGAAAIELALHGLNLPWGSRVLVSALGSIALAQAIAQAGHCPVLVDVSPETGMPTPEIVSEAAGRTELRDHPVRAMVVVHAAGDPVDLQSLVEAAGLPLRRVVQDASEALGGSLTESPVGAEATA